jgi:methionine-rich copper-binding protein CopC
MSAAVTVLVVLLVTFALVASALPVFAAPAAAAEPAAEHAAAAEHAGTAALLPLHARLVSTTPADGATVPTAEQVTLTFTEDVDPRFLVVRVTGPAGDDTQGSPVVRGRTVTQPLVPDLSAGPHSVAYRVVSVDGHAVAGTLAFTTTAAPPAASPDATSSASPSASPSAPSATPTPTPSPSPSPSTVSTAGEAGVPGWVWVAGLVVLLVLLGAAAWRRLSRPPSGAANTAPGDAPREGPGEDADGPFRG